MMREAKTRIKAIEKKTKKGIEDGMIKVFLSILFSKLEIDTKRYCHKEGGRESFEILLHNIQTLNAPEKTRHS